MLTAAQIEEYNEGDAGIEKFSGLMVPGQVREPRLDNWRVRLPLPSAVKQDSLHDNQPAMKSRFFATLEAGVTK